MGSVLSPVAGGGSPTLALAPELILEAPQLCSGQLGQPPDDLLYHPPPFPTVYADTMIIHARAGHRDSAPLNSQHGARSGPLIGCAPTGSGRAARSTVGRRGPGFSAPRACPTARSR